MGLVDWDAKLRWAFAAALFFSMCGCHGDDGSASNLALCHASCDSGLRCGVLNDMEADSCHRDCERRTNELNQQDMTEDGMCGNAPDQRRQMIRCSMVECDQRASCLASIDKTCVMP